MRTARFTPTGVGTAERGHCSPVSRSVHPHRRGDGGGISRDLLALFGSPPQAWGRRRGRGSRRGHTRFTPTGVGTAWPHSAARCKPSVHPHRRGDGARWASPPSPISGSPPQAWGRLLLHEVIDKRARFTPTGVGTARPTVAAKYGVAVHPHRRGDGTRTHYEDKIAVGSPPQAWGRRVVAPRVRPLVRFTPTGVGTARSRPTRAPACAVHPHRRGDGADTCST